MPSTETQLDAARTYRSNDVDIIALVDRCKAFLADVTDMPEFALLVVDYGRGVELRESPLVYTESCTVTFEPPTVLVAERFLLEIEAAVRSFGLARPLLGCQYLRSDEDLFAFAHRVRTDLPGLLKRLRRRKNEDAEYALTLILFFFVAHEVGHLLADAAERSYATFIRADAPLETRVANAAMKLCRHVDEFARYGFDLPYWDFTANSESDVRQRERELTSTKELATIRKKHARYFDDEASADDTAVQILVEHLARLAENDETTAMRAAALAIGGLFAAGVFTWYRDLLTFGEKLGTQRPPDARTLTVKMLQGRETYIHAASLFGNEHRFTLLRAALAAEAIMRSRSDYFDRDDRTIWWTKPEPAGDPWWRSPLDAAWWEKEALQRYWLLCILMDTAVKISYTGCSTAWMLDADRERGSDQMLVMNFESVTSAVRRLRQQLR